MQLHARRSGKLHARQGYDGADAGYFPAEMAPPPSRIHIQYPQPVVDAGKYPAKRTVGDLVEVTADVFRDGHEKLRAVAVYRRNGDRKWREAELHALDAHHNGVRWGGSFVVDAPGSWEFSIEAWTDVFATWRDELRRKLEAGQHDLSGELSEGVLLLKDVAGAGQGRRPQADRARAARADRRGDPRGGQARRGDGDGAARRRRAQRRAPRRHAARSAAAPRGRPRARPLRLVVRGLPALVGRPQGRRGPGARARRAGLRRALHDADPPDRHDEPQGPQQHARRRTGRPRLARTRSAPPRAATTPCTRTSAPSTDVRSLCATAAEHDMDIAWTSRSTRPPTTRG